MADEPVISTLDQAVQVLNRAQHRGARSWGYDAVTFRVMPASWGRPEIPPCFTAFEALAVARQLVAIGVGPYGGPQMAPGGAPGAPAGREDLEPASGPVVAAVARCAGATGIVRPGSKKGWLTLYMGLAPQEEPAVDVGVLDA